MHNRHWGRLVMRITTKSNLDLPVKVGSPYKPIQPLAHRGQFYDIPLLEAILALWDYISEDLDQDLIRQASQVKEVFGMLVQLQMFHYFLDIVSNNCKVAAFLRALGAGNWRHLLGQGCDRCKYFGSPNKIQNQIRLVLLVLTYTKIRYHYGKMANFVSPNQLVTNWVGSFGSARYM